MTCSDDGTVRVWDVRGEGKKSKVRYFAVLPYLGFSN